MEEGGSTAQAGVPQLADPRDRFRLRMPAPISTSHESAIVGTAGFAACDEPRDAVQVDARERSKQRLGTDEPHGRVNLAQVIDPSEVRWRFHGHADPDVPRPRFAGMRTVPVEQTLRPFGQNLEHVMVSAPHDVEHALNECIGNPLVEQIAHAVDEDPAGSTPAQREIKTVRVKSDVGKLASPPALGHSLCVTELAPRGDLRAASDGIPCGVGPLDRAQFPHSRPHQPQKE